MTRAFPRLCRIAGHAAAGSPHHRLERESGGRRPRQAETIGRRSQPGDP